MSYKIIEEKDQGKLIEIEIDGKKHQTFAVCQRDGKEDANLDDVVEAFKKSITNPPTVTPFDDSAKKASGKAKLKELGLDDDEIKALTGA